MSESHLLAANIWTEPLAELPLHDAPLARVLTQMRFDNLGVFIRENAINPLVEQLLDEYPVLQEGFEGHIVVSPSGVQQEQSANKIWRLANRDGSWAITVSRGSLAFETTKYSSRTDFIDRFQRVVAAFNRAFNGTSATRLGIRYTNQFSGAGFSLEEASSFIREEARGGLSIPTPTGGALRHSVHDSLISFNEFENLQARWGILPGGMILDPTLPAVANDSWFLDLDSFTTARIDSDSPALLECSVELAERAYRLFRYLVTDSFIDRFGS